MTERAKWDAWSAASQTHEGRGEEAEKRYLEIARGLGWTLGAAAVPTSVDQSRKQSDEATNSSDDIWDFETDGLESDRGDGGNGGVGMATSVSAMAAPPLDEQDAKSLHGLAVANNVLGLSSYLDACPGISINNLDEHVCTRLFPSLLLVFYCSLLQGYTALHLACDRGNAAAVELLLRRGADCNLKVRKMICYANWTDTRITLGSRRFYGLGISKCCWPR
jgi:hypothetical protein